MTSRNEYRTLQRSDTTGPSQQERRSTVGYDVDLEDDSLYTTRTSTSARRWTATDPSRQVVQRPAYDVQIYSGYTLAKAVPQRSSRQQAQQALPQQVSQEQIKRSTEDEALRTLEEELADLEELWPHKPFELKKSILQLLIQRVVIDQMSTKFFRVLVEWKYKEWGIEQTYLSHKDGGRKEWSEEEIGLLQKVYLEQRDTRDRLGIMQALPHRSWRAIKHMIDNIGINLGKGKGSGGGLHFKREQIENDVLSWNDIEWLQKSGLTYKSLCSNEVGWSLT